MKIGIYASVVASERGHERNVSGHIQVPAQTIRLLRDAGHDVHLISNTFGPDRSLPTCMPTDGPMHFVDDGRRRPKTLRGEPSPGGIRLLPLLRQLRQIRSIVRRERLDVLHVFGYTRSAMLGGVLRLLFLGAPVVVTLVGTAARPPGRVGRRLLRRLDAVVTATETTAARAREWGLRPQVIRHGIVRDLRAEHGDASAAAAHRVLFWRDASEQNGADVCLAAFDQIAAALPDLSFDIAVRPIADEVPGVEELAERHRNVAVHRFPYADGVTIAGLIAESLLVVLPFRWLSVDPQFAIAETLAAGVPVIGTNVGSIPELIEDGVTGAIVPPGEVEPLVAALRRLLADRAGLAEMRRVTAERFAARWNWDRYTEELESVYRAVSGRA